MMPMRSPRCWTARAWRRAGGRTLGLTYAGTHACLEGVITRRIDELVQLVHRENGKPVDDALLEVLAVIDDLDWAAKDAQRVLRRRRVRTTLITAIQTASLETSPSVVGVTGPWNSPVFAPMGSIVYARRRATPWSSSLRS